jgi:hypothetical protein
MQAFSEAAEGIRTLDLLHGKQNVLRRFPRNIPANRKGFRDGCADRLPRDLPGVHGGLGSEWVVSNRDSGRPHRPGAMACLPCLAAAPRHAAAGRSPWRPATPGTPTRLVCSSGRDPGEEAAEQNSLAVTTGLVPKRTASCGASTERDAGRRGLPALRTARQRFRCAPLRGQRRSVESRPAGARRHA